MTMNFNRANFKISHYPGALTFAVLLTCMTTAFADDMAPNGTAVIKSVKPDGSGDFSTVQAAIDAVPVGNKRTFVINIAPGRYNEQLWVPKGKDFITLKGMGTNRNQVVLVSGVQGSPTKTPTGVRVDPKRFEEVTLTSEANDFHVENLTLDNAAGGTSGPNQALRAGGDRQSYENVAFLGWQDTLFLNKANTRSYFHNCDIWGSVDFIFGSATAAFEQCDITQRRDVGGPATAPSTPQEVKFGLVFLNCHVVKGPDVKPQSSTLMRPWREYGESVFINCIMDDHITPQGWSEWGGREATCRAKEFNSKTPKGQPIDLATRAPWVKRLTAEEAARYTILAILFGADGWNPIADTEPTINQK